MPPNASLHPSIASGLTAVADAACVLGTGLAVYSSYVGWHAATWPQYLCFITLGTLAVLGAFSFAGLYEVGVLSRPGRQLHKIFVLCSLTFMSLAVLAFAMKISDQFSRVWAFVWFFSVISAIWLARGFGHAILSQWARNGRLARNVAVVGAGIQGQRLVQALKASDDTWIRIVGVFDDRRTRIPNKVARVPVVGDLERLADVARRHRIDDILVALPWAAEDRQLAIIEKLSLLPAHIQLGPDMIGFDFPGWSYDRVGVVPCLKVLVNRLCGWNAVLKAAEDRLIAGVVLLTASPLLLLIAGAIKLDSRGPVFFMQKRYGFNSQLIEVCKFRTMYHDPAPDPQVPQAKRNDPRVTRVGKVLRRTSLDELPQIFNVLKGDMSVVGPRPHAVAHDDKYSRVIDKYLGRFKVKPGITGWAQVNGWRGETGTVDKMRARIEHDLHYIENWSIAWDLLILLRTVGIVAWGRNAY